MQPVLFAFQCGPYHSVTIIPIVNPPQKLQTLFDGGHLKQYIDACIYYIKVSRTVWSGIQENAI